MNKSKKYGIVMLVAFLGILALPCFSAPAKPHEDKDKAHFTYFENADEHANHWVLRSVAEGEEFSNRGENSHEEILFFDCCINHHSNIYKVRLEQIEDSSQSKLPKDRLYLLNSTLTI